MNLSEVSVRKMRVLLTVRAVGSFTKAAVKLNMSQPAVTIIINQIESAAETFLFVRSGQTRKAILNEEGVRVAGVFSRIVGGYDQELLGINSAGARGQRKLGISIQDQLAIGLEFSWLSELIVATPGDIAEIKCGTLDAVMDAVSAGDSVAGLISHTITCDSVDFWPVQEYGYDLIIPYAQGNSGDNGDSHAAASVTNCVVLGGIPLQSTRQIERYLAMHCKDADHTMNVDSPSILKQMVQLGESAAVVPSYLTSRVSDAKTTKVISMSPEVHGSTIGLVTSPSYATRTKYAKFSHMPAFNSRQFEWKAWA